MANTQLEKLRQQLANMAEPKYQKFHAALLPGIDNVLGIRTPILRKIAKELSATSDWRLFIENSTSIYYEEVMLQGMIIGSAKMEPEERLAYIQLFVPRINNWAVCDIFCGGLQKAVKKDKERMWKFIQPYLISEKEYEKRFGIVMLFHFIEETYIDFILAYADTFRHEGYYARMGMAWLLSTCYVKFPEKTRKYLQQSKLETWTYNKAIQKTIESLRVTKEEKEILRAMKRK